MLFVSQFVLIEAATEDVASRMAMEEAGTGLIFPVTEEEYDRLLRIASRTVAPRPIESGAKK